MWCGIIKEKLSGKKTVGVIIDELLIVFFPRLLSLMAEFYKGDIIRMWKKFNHTLGPYSMTI